MRHPLILAAALLAAGVPAANAATFAQRDPAFPQRAYTCRLAGEDRPLGARACLTTPQGRHPAECGIVLNMSTWQAGEGSCS